MFGTSYHFLKVGFILPLFLCLRVGAQNTHFGFNFTPRAGVCFSYSGDDALAKKTFKISPEGGIEAKLDLSKHFGITTGVYYNQKAKYYRYQTTSSFFTDLSSSIGGFIDVDTLIQQVLGTSAGFVNDSIYSHYRGKVNIHYIQVPLMATLDIKNLSISAGGYIAFAIRTDATEELTQEFPLYSTFQPVLADPSIAPYVGLFTSGYPAVNAPVVSDVTSTGFVNSTDYGLAAEIACRFDGRFKMAVNATYGLSDYSNNPDLYPGKHFALGFNMGITFGKIKGQVMPVKFF